MLRALRVPCLLGLLIAGVAWPAPAIAAGSDDLQDMLTEVRQAALDPDRAVRLRETEVPVEPARLLFLEGILIPATVVGGAVHEAVFVGRAAFRFEPPDEIEAKQLDFLTKQRVVDTAPKLLVLLSSDAELLGLLLRKGESAVPSRVERRSAEALFDGWRSQESRRFFEAEAAILQGRTEGNWGGKSLALWMRSEDLGSFFFSIDPSEHEQLRLGSFEARPDEEYHDRWDIESKVWIQSALRDPSGRARHGSTGFESRHYELDTTIPATAEDAWEEKMAELHRRIEKRQELEYFYPGRDVEGRARIEIVTEMPGRRFIRLKLHPTLRIKSVTYGEAEEPFWFRSGWNGYVILPSPADVEENLELTVVYEGEVLDEMWSGHCSLRSTYSWYPRIGTIDRATYEMTFRWPEASQLLASGVRLEEGVEKGMRWERRILPVPSLSASFEFGEYDIVEERIGRFTITVAFNRIRIVQDVVRKEVVEVIKGALLHFETIFGLFPLDHLTVVTVERDVSQGFLGFVTLSHSVLLTEDLPSSYGILYDKRSVAEIRAELLAHEISHQWWGNKVGWTGYRDQWLSEALADYSALEFMSRIGKSRARIIAQRGREWRSKLLARTMTGQTVEELGPVSLGNRLGINHGDEAYSAIVYDKGAVIFSMLAQMLGRGPFNRMLSALADAVNNRVIDTDTFLRSIEHMSGTDLQLFAKRYIYGTGVPEMFYDYRIVPRDGGWTIEGQVRQVSAPQYRYRPVHAEGRWLVRREVLGRTEAIDLPLVVPFQVALARSGEEARESASEQMETGLGGTIVVRGAENRFEIPLDREPRQMWLDQRSELLVNFFSFADLPKRTQRFLAEEQAALEETADAERTFRAALAAEVFGAHARPADVDDDALATEGRLQDTWIHLGLARLYMDQLRFDDARVELRVAESLLDAGEEFAERERCILRGRLELAEGRFQDAYRRLKDLLLPSSREWRQAYWKERIEMWEQDAESFVLLAVAAHEAGHAKMAHEAMQEAERRGANMDALRRAMER